MRDILFKNCLIAQILIKTILFMVNSSVFEAVLTGTTNGMILAKSQSAIFISMLCIAFST